MLVNLPAFTVERFLNTPPSQYPRSEKPRRGAPSTILAYGPKSHKGEELGVDRLLRDFLKDQSGEPDCDQFLLFCKQKMTDELCDLINKDTISQAKSPLWYALRFSRDCILSL